MSLVLGKYTPTIYRRLWSKVERNGECWEWQGTVLKSGYGHISARTAETRGSVVVRAHRAAWEIANNQEIPDGSWVLHSCDNRRCVRPSHLRLGDRTDNVRDCVNRGRHVCCLPGYRGEQHPQARLTEIDVRRMRKARACGALVKDLASHFNTSPTNVSNICNRRVWTHV